jgi:hypothetical protein
MWWLVQISLGTTTTVAVAIATGGCSSPTARSSSDGGARPSSTTMRPSVSPHRTRIALSTRTVSPLVIEDVKIQFYQDYSFVTPQKTPLSPQELTALTGELSPTSIPPDVVIANQEWIVLTVAGNSPAPVTINDMTIIKNCQKPPAGGTLFYSPVSGAGGFVVAPVLFNLSQPDTVGQYLPTEGSTIPAGGNFFAKEVITLKYHEPQTLAVFVIAPKQYCKFYFKLNVATVKGPAIQKITDHGQPFTITADGEPSFASPDRIRPGVAFSSYAVVYAGGIADLQHNGEFLQVNPQTYKGTGNPASFPPH